MLFPGWKGSILWSAYLRERARGSGHPRGCVRSSTIRPRNIRVRVVSELQTEVRCVASINRKLFSQKILCPADTM